MTAEAIRTYEVARVAQMAEDASAIEQFILGAVMLGGDATLRAVQDIIGTDDFASDDHRALYDAACVLQNAGSAVDSALVLAELEHAGKLAAAGGAKYIEQLVAAVPTAVNAAHYARVLRDRADVRRVRQAALTVANEAMQAGVDAPTLRARFEQLMPKAVSPGSTLPGPITPSEWTNARPTPDCIVENYLFADVAVIVAPGGTGKTTLLLHEAIHIALGIDLYGLKVYKPGPVLIITAEDSRELIVARLRLIAEAMHLDTAAITTIMRDIRISDVSGLGFKLTTIVDDIVLPAPQVDIVIREGLTLRPVLVVIDPAVSFGVGENRINDAEQGLVEAARRIRNALGCCVRYVHHSGKQNARDKAVDQYAGRGGSAFADGARMVAVLQPLTSDEWRKATGMPLLDGETGLVLARPKLSYCPPCADILISRKGYVFAHTSRAETNPATKLQANCDQILQAIKHDLGNDIRHTQNSLEALDLKMSRKEVRDAVSTLIARGLVEQVPVPDRKKGGTSTYLQSIAAPKDPCAPMPKNG